MRISAWAIQNPIPSILLFLVLTLSGIVSFLSLGVDELPSMDLPLVMVSVNQLGASPEELEVQVTRRIEDAVSGLGQIRHISSTINQGVSNTTVEFEIGTDIHRVVDDVRDAVSSVRSQLPADIEEPTIQRVDAFGGAFATYIVRSPSLDIQELSALVDEEISPSLLSVKGVGRVERSGGVEQEIAVSLQPERLRAYGITAERVNDELRRVNINLPSGRAELADLEQTVRSLGSQPGIEGLRSLQLPTLRGGTVSLETLGEVTKSSGEPRQIALFNGKPVVAFSLFRSQGSSIATTQAACEKQLEQLEKQLPAEAEILLVKTSAVFINESYLASLEHLGLGAGLAVLVILFFLKDWRASAISALAIPLSVLPTFAAMKAVGYTLNNLTLLGLALVVGILVDDAIVEIENIVRHIHLGKSPYEASLEAADEIGLAVVATTFTIIVVFVPMAFMGGIPGQFFGPFGLVVAVSVFFSLLVARLLTPLLAAHLMVAPPRHNEESGWAQGYCRALHLSLRHPWSVAFGGLAFFVLSLYLATLTPTSLLDPVDRSEVAMRAELAPGTRLEQTTRLALEVSRRLQSRPEVESVFVSIGASSDGSPDEALVGSVNRAEFHLTLIPRNQRRLEQSELELELQRELRSLPGVRWSLGTDDGFSGKLQLTLTSKAPALLTETEEQLLAELKAVPGLHSITSSSALFQPELQIEPDPDRASELGVTSESIAHAVLLSTLGAQDFQRAKFNLPDRQIAIHVALDTKARREWAQFEALQVESSSGALVPLGSVARLRVGRGATELRRVDRARELSVHASLTPGLTLGEALERVHQIPTLKNLPVGVTEQTAGDAEIQSDIFRGFALAMGSAVLGIYVVLVLLFQDFVAPLTIMVSLPLSLGGAILALLITGKSLGMYALIGIIMLMGLVTKNAILLIEYGIVLQRNGTPRRQALIEAGQTRLRPILMTTVAMIVGMVPIALGVGAGAEARSPMATAVIGGLISSTVLTLLVVPAVYILVDDFQVRLKRLFTRRRG